MNDCDGAPGVVGDCVIVDVRMRGGFAPLDGVGSSDDLALPDIACIAGDLVVFGSDE